MPHPFVKSYIANFTTPTGLKSFDLIFSSDFTGTVNGVAYDGSKDAVQSFSAGDDQFGGGVPVDISSGTVRLAGVTN